MTRVLQAIAGSPHGGAETFFERLTVALHRAGETQRLVIRREPARAARLRAAGLEVIELPFGGILDWETKRRLRRAIAEFQPRVVLTWMSRATAACPTGDFVHVARLGGYYDLKYYRDCDYLIGNTRGLVAHLRQAGWPADRVDYLPNFAVPLTLAPVPRAAFATPEGAPLAVALGRLHPSKGFDLLLAAVALVPGLYLWLAGEGPLAGRLQAQAARLGIRDRVRFIGWREDAAALLAAADMLVCPSRIEPLGNTILEAFAARVPVVAAAASGPRELIGDGSRGLLVPVGDSAALAAAMIRLAGDAALRARLVQSAYADYEAEFGEARVVAEYRDFLARVAR
jgi:glycosyltransferase involved in cell wall biosynthesis